MSEDRSLILSRPWMSEGIELSQESCSFTKSCKSGTAASTICFRVIHEFVKGVFLFEY